MGRRLFSRLGPERAVATYNTTPIEHGVYFDALSMQVTDIVDKKDVFSHALILLGNTKPDSCAKDLEQSTYLNVSRTQLIIDQLRTLGIVPVFTSSEVVFDGEKGNYVETDPVHPLLAYGVQKVQIEEYLQETCPDFVVVRLARVFGSRRGDGTLFIDWLEQIEQNLDIRCAYNHIFSPIHIDEVVEALIQLMQRNCRGIFHLSNKYPYRRIDMLNLLIESYREYRSYDGRVIECSLHDFPVMERRALNVSLRPDKIIRATGIEILSVETWCKIITHNWFQTGIREAPV